MAPRLELHQALRECIGNDNVYFQPPENIEMSYPCIVYNRDSAKTGHADNAPYSQLKRYQVTVITRGEPDSPIPDAVAALSTSQFSRFFVADGLTHDVFTVFA